MKIQGIYADKIARDEQLISTLAREHMARYRAVPRTVMVNQWQEDLAWIVVDDTYPQQIARRYALLQERLPTVIDRLPGEEVQAAEEELRDAVAAYALDTYPAYFKRDGNVVLSLLTGLVIDVGPNGADPLVAVALLASEDMLLLLPEQWGSQGEVSYILKSGALLFPNDWALRSHFNQPPPATDDSEALHEWEQARQKSLKAARLGKTPYEIHEGHVSHYMEHFASRVDRFFTQMTPGMRTWRRNWGMRMTDELFLHSDVPPPSLPALSAENWEQYGYLRSEHETFNKLPESGAVVFSIKTYLWKLSELVKHPVALEALLMANENLAPKMAEYRQESLPSFREFLERHRFSTPVL